MVMVQTVGRVRCACQLHACPSSPQLGDPLCRFCREHCYVELARRQLFRRRALLVIAAILIFGVSWLAGHFFGPTIYGG
jgi:hypothetical protein